MARHPRRSWRTSSGKPIVYWLVGALILWMTLPVGVADLFLAPDWWAPHWQCDSLSIPLFEAYYFAPWFAVFSLIMAGGLTVLATRKRQGGSDIFDLNPGRSVRSWIVTALAAVLIAPLVISLWYFARDAMIVQTLTVKCGGRAEDITVSMRRPVLQVTPLVELALIFWLLHLRAFAVSPRRD